MASIARASSRSALRSASITSSTRSTMHDIPLAFPRHASRQQFRRGYASGRISQAESSKSLYWGLGLALTGGVGFVAYSQTKNPRATPVKQDLANSQRSDKKDNQDDGQKNDEWMPKQEDYQKVYDAIAEKFVEEDEYDDGSYGPVVLRLAWHASGTYDAETGTGGSNGATMRFDPEGDHGANAGLKNARDFLAPLKDRFPWISYSDLWTLAGVCAIQEMQGPTVPWRPGRQDRDIGFCTPDGRLPDGAKGPDHLRAIFGRMGFDDREIVALSGAHALGRCHTDRSGFEGPWTFSPTTLTNDFFKFLLETEWHWRQWDGPRQYQDKETKSLMMLPTDMALVQDELFKPHVERYAKDEAVFFKEFSEAVCKLFELGVPFTVGEDARMELKRSE